MRIHRTFASIARAAALLGLGLATAGGYATLRSEADVFSGRFSSHKTEKVEFYANGQKTAHLKGLPAKDMKAGDMTAPQSVTLSNKGNTDINSIVLKTSIPDREEAKALAEVIDIEVTGGHGILPTTVKHSLAEFVKGHVDLSNVGGSFWAYCAKEYRYVPILTGSMEPGIAKGTLVITEPVPTREMAAGQVIVLMPPEPWTPSDGLPTVHRIAGITHGLGGAVHMTTKGDANGSADPWRIDLTDGAGEYARVVYQVPHLGDWIVTVKSLGLLAGISLAAGAVLLWYAAKWALRLERRRVGGAAVPPAPTDP
ncbi:hypothetical protein [Streptomyces sp. NPDC059564]|uniref:hypothetical protein n=1 Tax=Streptomyces sp. NPDC059564 TaxID=3346865 RepID=UPI0036893ED6